MLLPRRGDMARRNAMAFGLLLIGSFCGSLWGADQKPARNRDTGQEALETVLRREVVSATDRRDALHEALEKHPDSPALRWQAGFVRVGKTWQSIEQASQSADRGASRAPRRSANH